MDDLLTTKQVQMLLHVDRTTIYRMVEGGELPALRVGKQWRFAQSEVERWLRGRRPAVPRSSNGERFGAAESQPDSDLHVLLSLGCVQLMQDTFADLLGVMMVITDMQGRPMTQVSNPCGFFADLTAQNPAAISQCVQTWQRLAGAPSLEPRWSMNEMGLLCARGLIRVGSELRGMIVVGGIAPEPWPPAPGQIEALAHTFGVTPENVAQSVTAVYRLDRAAQEKVLRSVQRVADVFSHLAEDRLRAASQPR